jgi:DNA-binding GntR family transcriptional regulator
MSKLDKTTPEDLQGFDEDPVVKRIVKAIRLGRIKPGTKLKEVVLADVFETNRTRIRQVLSHLSSKGLVNLLPNRGAFVAKPTLEEARQVFAARRVVEAATVSALANARNPKANTELRLHMVSEKKADEQGDTLQRLLVAGDFHVLIARLAGNSVLASFVEDLVLRTGLIIAEYEAIGFPHCSCEAHHRLVELITSGDAEQAVSLMMRHIDELEEPLLSKPKNSSDDIRAIFSEI